MHGIECGGLSFAQPSRRRISAEPDIQNVEELLGLSLITRGSTRKATLTDDGVELMYLFETLENEVSRYAQKALEEELRDNPLFH
jgi:molybdenum-dependent DNA-binding transcriptional regulator ModE